MLGSGLSEEAAAQALDPFWHWAGSSRLLPAGSHLYHWGEGALHLLHPLSMALSAPFSVGLQALSLGLL